MEAKTNARTSFVGCVLGLATLVGPFFLVAVGVARFFFDMVFLPILRLDLVCNAFNVEVTCGTSAVAPAEAALLPSTQRKSSADKLALMQTENCGL